MISSPRLSAKIVYNDHHGFMIILILMKSSSSHNDHHDFMIILIVDERFNTFPLTLSLLSSSVFLFDESFVVVWDPTLQH